MNSLKKKGWQVLVLCLVVFSFRSVYAQQGELVTYQFTCPDTVGAGDTLTVNLTIAIEQGWHVYSPDVINEQQGMVPIGLTFDPLPAGLKLLGELEMPDPEPYGTYMMYTGTGLKFTQRFTLMEDAETDSLVLRGKFVYQACNDHMCYPQVTEILEHKIHFSGSGADAAWIGLQSAAKLFADSAEYSRYKALAPLAKKRYEDRSKLAQARAALEFWHVFPTDPRRIEALQSYLSADPLFITRKDNEALDTVKLLDGVEDWKKFSLSIVIDTTGRNEWLKQGDSMVSKLLQENDSISVKERVAFSQFARDFRLAAREFSLQYTVYDENEYWTPYYERFQQHAETYAELSVIALRAKDFLAALKGRSPNVAAQYWQQLQAFSANEGGRSAGLRALHASANEQLRELVLEAGTTPVEMEFTTLKGEHFSLKDLRGKVVLIDFWASWCKPCLEELPYIKAMYDKYHKQGFEVVGICLDDATVRNRAVSILQKQDITWPQRLEGKGFSSDTYRLLYGINSLPTVWLLAKNGKIVDRNARGEKLEQLIVKQLK